MRYEARWNRLRCGRRGQVLVMVTLAIFAMCGLIGLAVDLGWSYFVKSAAQRAADAAALAAAEQAWANTGAGPYACGTGLVCQVETACPSSPASPPSDNIGNGCLYALRNGFSTQGHNGRQNVTLQADTTSPPPTVPGVVVEYWATARVSETVPQLFSALLGNTEGTVSAQATAAIADSITVGNLWGLNRENDPNPADKNKNAGSGLDLTATGNGSVKAGAIILASASSSAGVLQGTSGVTADSTVARGGVIDPHGQWQAPPSTGMADGDIFQDPMRGKGQPPIPGGLVDTGGTPGGTIGPTGGAGSCLNLNPGVYYTLGPPAGCTGTCAPVPNGQSLNFTGCVNFTAGGGNFGTYVFVGGVHFGSGTFTFSPGEYVLAGVLPGPVDSRPFLWSQVTNAFVTDMTPLVNGKVTAPGANNPGELFVFTDPNYVGGDGVALRDRLPATLTSSPIINSLVYGTLDIQMGNNDQSGVNLHGLNRLATNPAPDYLSTFAPTVWWQDQQNSTIKYTLDGNIDTTSCGSGHDINTPCTRPASDPELSTVINLDLQAHPNLNLWGAIYQPRGSGINFQGNGGISGPVMVVTGSFATQGGADLTLNSPGQYFTRRIVNLVE